MLQYSGLSTAAGMGAVDQIASNTATSGGASGVSSGPTAPTAAAGELAVGFYADSGFSNTLAGDPSYAVRTNVSPVGDIEMLVQDQVLTGAGAAPNPLTATGPNTPWLAATVVFKTTAPAAPPTAPATPGAPSATAGDGQATVTWTAPDNGGSTITKYTVTPYAGSTALTAGRSDGRARADQRDDRRPHQRHDVHLQGQGHERGRLQRRFRGLERRHAGRCKHGRSRRSCSRRSAA